MSIHIHTYLHVHKSMLVLNASTSCFVVNPWSFWRNTLVIRLQAGTGSSSSSPSSLTTADDIDDTFWYIVIYQGWWWWWWWCRCQWQKDDWHWSLLIGNHHHVHCRHCRHDNPAIFHCHGCSAMKNHYLDLYETRSQQKLTSPFSF